MTVSSKEALREFEHHPALISASSAFLTGLCILTSGRSPGHVVLIGSLPPSSAFVVDVKFRLQPDQTTTPLLSSDFLLTHETMILHPIYLSVFLIPSPAVRLPQTVGARVPSRFVERPCCSPFALSSAVWALTGVLGQTLPEPLEFVFPSPRPSQSHDPQPALQLACSI